MNKVILNSEKILDNIIEGYSVKATRMDGYEYIISMERVKGRKFTNISLDALLVNLKVSMP